MSFEKESPVIHQWTHEPLNERVREAIARLSRLESVRHIAVMPDVHLAENICVGTVVATKGTLLPQAIGGDIGCGMAILAFDVEASAIDSRTAAAILNRLHEDVPIKRHHRHCALPLASDLQSDALSDAALESHRDRNASLQLGTLGAGNHFLELQTDEEDRLWLMVHSGSRGMGQAISDHHWPRAARSGNGFIVMKADSSEGQAYWHDLHWAVRYAVLNRREMATRTATILRDVLGCDSLDGSYADCTHNFVRLEEHSDHQWFVHRKGAISANAGEFGVIPGSMGTQSYHVTGRGHAAALRSSSHGAGRAMSRSEARRRITPRDLKRQTKDVWFDPRMSRAMCEEAPEAYKDIQAVMQAQKELTCVVRRLRPLVSYKGG